MKPAIFGFPIVLLLSCMGCTAEPDRILTKVQGEDNRCHMKIETYGDPINADRTRGCRLLRAL